MKMISEKTVYQIRWGETDYGGTWNTLAKAMRDIHVSIVKEKQKECKVVKITTTVTEEEV